MFFALWPKGCLFNCVGYEPDVHVMLVKDTLFVPRFLKRMNPEEVVLHPLAIGLSRNGDHTYFGIPLRKYIL